jgi:hypothetical protein
MVVVLGHKIQMIHKPHGLLQTWMQHGASKERRLKCPHAICETESRSAELSQNLNQLASIVVGFMGLAIGQVREGEHVSTCEKVVYTRHPQRLQIEQMAGVLLGRPLVCRPIDQHVARYAAQYLFDPRRNASQADADARVLLRREREVEFPFKLHRNLAHRAPSLIWPSAEDVHP